MQNFWCAYSIFDFHILIAPKLSFHVLYVKIASVHHHGNEESFGWFHYRPKKSKFTLPYR